jgi:hypothetical protein
VFPGPGSGLPSKKWGDSVSDDPVVDVDEGLFPFPLELLDPHPPARAATTIRAAAPSEAELRSEVRFEVVISVLPCGLQSTGIDAGTCTTTGSAGVPPRYRRGPPAGGRCLKIPDDGGLGRSTPALLIRHRGLTNLTVASPRTPCVSFLWARHVGSDRGRHGSHGLDI